METKNVSEMTIAEFRAVPLREHWDSVEAPFDALVILPGKGKHESGYRNIEVVGCRKGKAVKRLAMCSDVIHIDGISGRLLPDLHPEIDQKAQWAIDCLPKSGCMRLFTGRGAISVGSALSSFEIYKLK